MRAYDEQNRLQIVKCNGCKKELLVEEGILKEGCFAVDYQWGYFSEKDGMRHKFDLCENCYEQWIQQFALPVTQTEESELL